MTVFLYQKLSPLVSLNALSAFFMATGLILLTLIPVVFLYQRLINKNPSVAAFTYCQFVIAAEISSLLANQTWQWDFFTIILTLCLYFIFKKEIRYISQEQTVITEDSRFFWSTILCMILVVAQAEFPRMFLDGNNSAVPTPIAYVVSFFSYYFLHHVVARYGLSRDQVHIEITESALNDSSQAMVEAVQHFHDLGYQVWMDDFGSGYFP